MNQMATDLRAAAASARAFADNVDSSELRHSFLGMARRWEAEADRCDRRNRDDDAAKPAAEHAGLPTSANLKHR